MTPRVLIAEGHPIFRTGMETILTGASDISVVGHVASAAELLVQRGRLNANVVVMDIMLQGLHDDAPLEPLLSGEARTVVLDPHPAPARASRLLEAGASGYLDKKCSRDELVAAIRHAHAGRISVCAEMTPIVRGRTTSDARMSFSKPSPRETEVLRLIAKGLNLKQIASRLHISYSTAKTHRERLMAKLCQTTDVGLVLQAIARGYIPIPHWTTHENKQ